MEINVCETDVIPLAARMDNETKHDFMLNTPMPKLVTRMALPAIAGMVVTSAYNLADTFFVSHLGTYATGAVGVNSAIDNIIMMAGSLMATGAASVNARLIGARREGKATEVLSSCYFIALIMGILVLIFGNIFEDQILFALGANEAILPYSRQYCQYILLAAPFMATSFVLNQCLRAEGSAIYSMIGMVTGAVLNIGLDPLFIFTFGWGVAGASAATAISKVVSWTILMLPYFKGKTMLKISLKHFKPSWQDTKDVCAMGSASFFRNGLATLASIMLNRIAVGYSESALAAISVANRITMFMTSACLGFGQGFQPVAGYSWGAKRYDRVREATRFSTTACIAGISVVALVVGVFAKPILGWFTESDEELVTIGVFCLRMQCLAMPAHGYGIIINMMCAGLGRAVGSTILGMSRQGICFYPVLFVAMRFFGVEGIAATQAAADILTMLIAIPIHIVVMRYVNRTEKQELDGVSAMEAE